MRVVLMVMLLVLLAVTGLPAASTVSPSTSATLKSLSALNGRAFDVAFMRELIPVNEEAVEVAMAATLNADHTQLLKWNQVLIDRKNAEIRQMLARLKAMGAQPTKRNVGVATAQVKKMRTLKSAALEKVYLPLMASHLDQSKALAALAAKKGSSADLQAFAQKVVKVETQEAAMLRGWLKQWYGVSAGTTQSSGK